MRRFIVGLLLSACLYAGQSLVFTSGATASNASVPSQGPGRGEFLLQNWSAPSGGSNILSGSGAAGWVIGWVDANTIQAYWERGNSGTGPCVGQPFILPLGGLPSTNVYVRFQHDPVQKTAWFEAWDATGAKVTLGGPSSVNGGVCTYTTIGAAPPNGVTIGGTAESVAFFRVSSSLVPFGAQMPVTAPVAPYSNGLVGDWKFDGNPNDSSGNGYTMTLSGSTSYAATGAVQNLVVSLPKTIDAPSWGTWLPLNARVGATNQLDGTASFSQVDATSAVSYLWSHVSGPSVLSYSNTAAGQPIVTNVSRGGYVEQLQVTDANSNTATTQLKVGAVAYDLNGVIIPSSQTELDFWGPQIAYGKNPWQLVDKLHFQTVGAQQSYLTSAMPFEWLTQGQGTISYVYAGIGTPPGVAGTTTTANILATDTAIPIADTTKLPGLSTLPGTPTIVQISGNGYNALPELVRVCSVTPGVGNAGTLNVCYDGRGVMVGGNNVTNGNYVAQAPSSWASGSTVGEFKWTGTGTLFVSDPARPLCPAGAPGPMGAVTSTFTATLTPGSATVTGTGFSASMVNGFVRVAATHNTGIPFIWWAQIISYVSPTQIVASRIYPASADAGSFPAKTTAPVYPTATVPGSYTTHGNTLQYLLSGVGCESEVAAHFMRSRDTTYLNTQTITGAKFSYKTQANMVTTAGTFDPNFYGSGLAMRNFYYRSGFQDALTLANYVDDNWVRDPEVGGGQFIGTVLSMGGGAIGAIADLLFNGSTPLTWADVETFADFGNQTPLTTTTACNAWDSRDSGYAMAWTTLASLYDTNLTNRAAYLNVVKLMLTRDQTCKRNAIDGYSGSQINSFAHAQVFQTGGPQVTLTTGSAVGTGTGFTSAICAGNLTGTITVVNGSNIATLVTGTLSNSDARIWITDGANYTNAFQYSYSGSTVTLGANWKGQSGTFAYLTEDNRLNNDVTSIWSSNTDNSTNNLALQKAWACTYNSPTQITLQRLWDGPNGTYTLSTYQVGSFGQQPFMLGIKANQMRWASKSTDPTVSAGYAAILPLIGAWYNSYGWAGNTANLGSYYDTVWGFCNDPNEIPAASGAGFSSIHGFVAAKDYACGYNGLGAGASGVSRTNSAEGGNAMMQYYVANPLAPNKAVVNKFYGAIFGLTAYCTQGVFCDGSASDHADISYLGGSKWPGFFFGMGGFFVNSWPAYYNTSLTYINESASSANFRGATIQ